jgi:hypothetical protein
MRHLAIILALVASAAAQGSVSGGKVSGGSVSFPVQIGYIADTSNTILQWPTTPNFGAQTNSGLVWQDTSYLTDSIPLGNISKVIRCTDQSLMAATNINHSKSAGLGGSGDAAWMFSADSKTLHFNDSGGADYLTLFNTTTLKCGDPVSGYAITADKNLSNPGSATTVYNFGSGSFDANTSAGTAIWYGAFSGNDAVGLQIIPYTINETNGQFTVGSPTADYQYGLPYGPLVSAWAATTAYTFGQYVTYTLTSGQAPDWIASNAYSTLGTIIKPLTNNPLGCALKLAVAGTSSGTEPTWSTSGACNNASTGQKTDGTAKWRYLGAGATFLFQLISSSGTSGSSTPAFVPVATGRPDLMTGPGIGGAATDNGLVWQNVGPAILPVWTSFAGISYDHTRSCSALSSNSYGYNNSYTNYNADQGSGIFVECYDSSINTYELINTSNGIQSKVTCTNSSYSCSGGTATITAQGTITVIAACPYFLHNSKGSWDMSYPILATQGGIGCATPTAAVWAPFQAFNATTSGQNIRAALNHWTVGKKRLFNVGQNCLDNTLGGSSCASGVFGFVAGQYIEDYDLTNPGTLANILTSWEPTCTVSWVSGNTPPPCGFGSGYDSHMSIASNPSGADTSPICGSVYNVGYSANSGTAFIAAPWQNEELCMPTSPTWAYGASPVGQNAPWRFTHQMNTMTNTFFDVQFAISQLSTDGNYLAFTSDMNCTLGDTNGNATNNCGLPWQSGVSYATNQTINPVGSLNGSGSIYDVFKITTPGTSGTTFSGYATPTLAWAACTGTPGCTVTDNNGVVYTDVGPGSAKGEVFIVQLVP